MEYGQELLSLIKCSLHDAGTKDFATESLDALFREAERHLVSGLIGAAFENSGGERCEQAHQAVAKAMRKNLFINNEIGKISAALEKEGIWHAFVKGAILKNYYPKQYMREMSDIDVLFDPDRAEDVKEIMEGMGYATTSFGKEHHDVYKKEPCISVEMHRTLFQIRHQMYDYYLDIKNKLVLEEGTQYRYYFNPEDFYVYMIAHEYVHFTYYPGTGIRSLVDTYVFLTRFEKNLDWEYIHNECEKIGMRDYENKNRLLSLHLFGDGLMTEEDDQFLGYYLTESIYGSTKDGVNNKVDMLGGGMIGRIRYVLRRLFPSMRWIKQRMPFIYKHKILLPAVPFIRIYQALFSKRKIAFNELNKVIEK